MRPLSCHTDCINQGMTVLGKIFLDFAEFSLLYLGNCKNEWTRF